MGCLEMPSSQAVEGFKLEQCLLESQRRRFKLSRGREGMGLLNLGTCEITSNLKFPRFSKVRVT